MPLRILDNKCKKTYLLELEKSGRRSRVDLRAYYSEYAEEKRTCGPYLEFKVHGFFLDSS